MSQLQHPPELTERIQRQAYHLWEAAGRPPGDGFHFWIEAEKLILKLNPLTHSSSSTDKRQAATLASWPEVEVNLHQTKPETKAKKKSGSQTKPKAKETKTTPEKKNKKGKATKNKGETHAQEGKADKKLKKKKLKD